MKKGHKKLGLLCSCTCTIFQMVEM